MGFVEIKHIFVLYFYISVYLYKIESETNINFSCRSTMIIKYKKTLEYVCLCKENSSDFLYHSVWLIPLFSALLYFRKQIRFSNCRWR